MPLSHTFRAMMVAGLVVSLLVACPALANDSSYFGSGQTVTAGPEPRVRMVAERVRIAHAPLAPTDPQLLRAGLDWSPSSLVQATELLMDCTFTFQNITDEAIDVQVGFPDSFQPAEVYDSPHPELLPGFRAWVRGEEVPVRHVAVDQGSEDPVLPHPAAAGEGGMAWVWPVRFGPRERLEIRNTARFGVMSSNGPLETCLWRLLPEPRVVTEAWWHVAPPPPCRHDPQEPPCASISYVVTTGAAWAGTIGRADIEIELPPGVVPAQVVAIPTASSIDERHVRWHFEDWEPEREVGLAVIGLPVACLPGDSRAARGACRLGDRSFAIPFHSVEQAVAWTTYARRNGIDRAAVRLQRNALFAARGRKFRDKRLQRAFEATSWYRPQDSMTPLGAEEWRIVAVLAVFERSRR